MKEKRTYIIFYVCEKDGQISRGTISNIEIERETGVCLDVDSLIEKVKIDLIEKNLADDDSSIAIANIINQKTI